MSFAAITLCDASQRVFILVVYFVVHLVPKLLDISSYRYIFCYYSRVIFCLGTETVMQFYSY